MSLGWITCHKWLWTFDRFKKKKHPVPYRVLESCFPMCKTGVATLGHLPLMRLIMVHYLQKFTFAMCLTLIILLFSWLLGEKEIKARIKELVRLRKNGITKLAGIILTIFFSYSLLY